MDGINKAIRALDKVGVFSRWTNVIGVGVLFLMVCVTFVDVILRYVFSRPITGVLEITEVMMILAIFLAVAHTHNEKGHITVDLISEKLSPRPKLILEFITTFLGLGTFVLVTWRTLEKTIFFVKDHTQHTQFFTLPNAPFSAFIVLGCTALVLLLLRDVLRLVVNAKEIGLRRYQWLLMFGIPILFAGFAILWMQPNLIELSLPTVGLIGVIFSLILFLSGMPISFALILTSILFISHIRGPVSMFNTLGTEVYRTAGSYVWVVLPFFVLLGYFCLVSKFGDDIYRAAYKWFGHLKGGLAITTIGACAAFAAIVGDSVSSTATMGSVALPQMRKYKYDDKLSSGSITGGSTLGPIIPPSVAFIIVGLLIQTSIGDLFVAGIIPGLLIALLFGLMIYIWCRINPKVGPAGEKSGWKERIISLKAGGPVVLLFVLVIGGIYTGIFTPIEGGAIGAVVAFLLGLVMRRFTWKNFTQALLDGGKVVSMVFLILISATLFTRFVAWCDVSRTISDAIIGAGLSPTIFMILILATLFIMGCFIDLMPLVLIGVPLLYPISVTLGIDKIWFAVLVVLTINVGALTPPVGMNLFTLKAVAKDIPMATIYRGAIPFVAIMLVAIAILFAVPSLSTWLPGVLK